MSTLQYFLSFLVSFSSILIPIICHEFDHLQPNNHVAFFIFGDSLFDAGMNNYINTTTDYQANFWPYGETFFNYPTGRFSNGRLMPDFIAEYAKLPLIPTYLPYNNQLFVHGVNFASGGAGALVESHRGYVVDLETQLSYFNIVEKKLKQKLGDAEAKTLLSKSVYLFSVGGNDYLVLFNSNSTYKSVLQSYKSKKEYVGMVIGNLTSTIKEIYKKGGRKFAFVNSVPLGCLPGVKILVPGNSGSCLEAALEMARLHNKELHKALQELERQLEGFKYANHDLYSSLGERINNPSRYGFKEATACCGIGPGRGNYTCGVSAAISDFFHNGRLLRELNATEIELVPKLDVPLKVGDFRPFFNCNVLYKAVSKIIANRVRWSLGDLVEETQPAFVSGRRISDNMFLLWVKQP
ncbi:hypothetical protein Pint_29344 [Pistacia integerrima]|uniref:Uncharacterized protein n=1 Tax=Pistacia integerrima TaxID=434235 RepID=A0ACC0X555_9ROSI|nr:hypothetical protein Pint_29344 [Pistacia integerrima]